MILEYNITELDLGKDIKFILKNRLSLSERLIKKLKSKNSIFCNSKPRHVDYKVKKGDVIKITLEYKEEIENIIPQDIPIDILYEDEGIIVLNKQPGIVVHPTSYHRSGTLVNALHNYYLKNNINKKIRPVSRLDKDTSGVLVFAKNQYVQDHLTKQINTKLFKKEYIGIVHGLLTPNTGTISLPIDRKPGSIMLRHISEQGAPSITHYEVLEYLKDASLVRFLLETGRTHQIRVHTLAINHPLLGDGLYSMIKTNYINRQALHSHKISFIHPIKKETIELIAPIPADFQVALDCLKPI